MANEPLKNALSRAGLTPERFADIIGVDPKTVQRWVAGRATPYPRHRATIARALDTTELELWPDTTPATDGLAPSGEPSLAVGDVIGSWGDASDAGAPDLVAFVSQARDRVDVRDDGRGLLRTPGLLAALVQRADDGCQVRVLVDAPSSELGSIIGHEQIEIRAADASDGPALLRVGDAMLLMVALAGERDRPGPLLHLHPQVDGGLFDRLAGWLDAEWKGAAVFDDSRLAVVLHDDPDGHDAAGLSGADGETPDPAEPSAEASPPRRWPRRPT